MEVAILDEIVCNVKEIKHELTKKAKGCDPLAF